jgi:hypothetical protein
VNLTYFFRKLRMLTLRWLQNRDLRHIYKKAFFHFQLFWAD